MKAPIPQEEEELITDYIYLRYLQDCLESDHRLVPKLNFKIPEVYDELVNNKLDLIFKEIVKVKKQLKALDIKVREPERVNEDFIEYYFTAHGYEGTMRFWDAAMKLEGTRRLKKIMS